MILSSAKADLIRAVALWRSPGTGWAEIARAPPAPRAVLLHLLAPMVALAAACPALGRAIFGETALGVTYRPPFLDTVAAFVIAAGLTLGGIALTAWIVDRCAPPFEGRSDFPRAFALVSYAATPALLAAAVTIVPALWPLALAGLYAIPLLVAGLPPMMRCPPDRATAYATVVVVSALVIFLVALALSACVMMLG